MNNRAISSSSAARVGPGGTTTNEEEAEAPVPIWRIRGIRGLRGIRWLRGAGPRRPGETHRRMAWGVQRGGGAAMSLSYEHKFLITNEESVLISSLVIEQ
jgi:hypothetical protein